MQQTVTQSLWIPAASATTHIIPDLPEEQRAEQAHTANDHRVRLAAIDHAKQVMGNSLNSTVCKTNHHG